MKKVILIILLCASGMMCQTTSAQISFKINIGLQPIWGPVGYEHVEYYYLPDIESYYYVPTHMYVYMERGRWITKSYLPIRYRNYDVYKGRKVVINEPRPYMHHNNYKIKYAKSYGHYNQQLIRDSHESKYLEIKDHPEHSKWKGNQNNKREDQYNKREDQNNKGQKQNNKDQKQNQKNGRDRN